jgi:ribosomal protein S21
MINVEVVKNNNENNLGILRRFTKRVQGSGVLTRVRSLRYANRKLSEYVKKKKTLIAIAKRENVHELIKMGKMVENTRGGRNK